MRPLHIINLSEVKGHAYVQQIQFCHVHRTDVRCMFILRNFFPYRGIRYVLKTITNVAAVVYRALDQRRLF